jgi:3-hydroxyethyl bacteriochlorophyllide a dehydrogenase
MVDLTPPTEADVVVATGWSGISTGTERLLYSGQMPPFPGMGYPLVPGYESTGRVIEAGRNAGLAVGDTVFVPGANCYGAVRGLFGGAASRIVVPGARVLQIDPALGERGVLLALAATAQHAVAAATPDLIVGHGVVGRLIARLAVIAGGNPTVWETNSARRDGATGYGVIDPAADPRRNYGVICDASGDAALLDSLIARLAPAGHIVLAGFYHERLSFAFPPAFMREARLSIAAQWQPADLAAVRGFVAAGQLSLDGLITHRSPARDAVSAYRTAFADAACLKMILDWSAYS